MGFIGARGLDTRPQEPGRGGCQKMDHRAQFHEDAAHCREGAKACQPTRTSAGRHWQPIFRQVPQNQGFRATFGSGLIGRVVKSAVQSLLSGGSSPRRGDPVAVSGSVPGCPAPGRLVVRDHDAQIRRPGRDSKTPGPFSTARAIVRSSAVVGRRCRFVLQSEVRVFTSLDSGELTRRIGDRRCLSVPSAGRAARQGTAATGLPMPQDAEAGIRQPPDLLDRVERRSSVPSSAKQDD